ncbi:unnamed protein product, partial [Lampetra planeri]
PGLIARALWQKLKPLRVSRLSQPGLAASSCSCGFGCGGGGASSAAESWKEAKSLYEFSATDIDGANVSLDKYRGHVCIVVNVATK